MYKFILKILIKKSINKRNILTLIVILSIFISAFFMPILEIAIQKGIKISPFGYAILMNDHVACLAMTILFLPIVCFALYSSNDCNEKNLITHSSRYVIAIILYSTLVSAIYVFMLNFLCIIALLPITDFMLDWGTAWTYLAEPSNIYNFFMTLTVDKNMISQYSPLYATFATSLFSFFTLFLISLIVASTHYKKSPIGILIAMAFLFLDMGIQNLTPIQLIYISPLSLSMLSIEKEFVGMIDNIAFIRKIFFTFSIATLIVVNFRASSIKTKGETK